MDQQTARQYWIETMDRICGRVLRPLSKGELYKELPRSFHAERGEFAPLEAFGRTACGIAPWLELEGVSGREAQLQSDYRAMLLQCVAAAVDPASADYMQFDGATGGQPLVDAAFLSHALVRAPGMLAGKLDKTARSHLVAALKRTRRIMPGRNNWLLFSAMVECALCLLGEEDWDKLRVDSAVQAMLGWYKGDGVYGDGADFHWDYYNSFVIHPMLVDITGFVAQRDEGWRVLAEQARLRAGRYAQLLERMIAPDGSYPVTGRSIVYRFGAFQILSQACLQGFLVKDLYPAQVRCALTAVMQGIMACPDNFDGDGWLQPGVYGHQPDLAEPYINTGSLYLCSAVFLPLGLPTRDRFWSDADRPWTSQRIWKGENLPADHAIRG